MFNRKSINTNHRSASRKRRNGFFEFGVDDFASTDRLIELFEFLARKRRSRIRGTEADQLHLLCCAEHALRCGNPPLRLFRWMKAKWPKALRTISCTDEDRAIDRLRVWRNAQLPVSPVSYAAELASSFGVKPPEMNSHHDSILKLERWQREKRT